MKPLKRTDNAIEDLIELMKRLRDPETGCPWDLEQNFSSIAPYTIEEAYEVSDAIRRNNVSDIKDELGDLFLQVVFHSQIAQDEGLFNVQDVARVIVDKMERRHPHVFGEVEIKSADAQTQAWEELKAIERASKKTEDEPASAMDGVALSLPSLMRSEKLLKRAARAGFEWPSVESVFSKMQEELLEVQEAAKTNNKSEIEEEIGDVLIVAADLARRHGVDPEVALQKSNTKFERRFRSMELAANSKERNFSDLTLNEMEELWASVKTMEKEDRSDLVD